MKKLLITTILSLFAAQTFAAQSVTLAWNPNTETNLAGYRLYWGTATRAYTQNNNVLVPTVQNTVSNLLEGQVYFFAVTAYTTEGLESDYSDEVSYTVPLFPPTNLTVANVQNKGRNFTLNWTREDAPNISGYKVSFGNSAGNYSTTVVLDKNARSYDFVDLTPGQRYYIVVKVVTDAGIESSSQELAYTVPLSVVTGLRIVNP